MSTTITILDIIKVYHDEREHFPNDEGIDIELNAMLWLVNDLYALLIKKYYPYANCEFDLNDKDLQDLKNRTKWLLSYKDNNVKKMLTDNSKHIGKSTLLLLLKLNGKI